MIVNFVTRPNWYNWAKSRKHFTVYYNLQELIKLTPEVVYLDIEADVEYRKMTDVGIYIKERDEMWLIDHSFEELAEWLEKRTVVAHFAKFDVSQIYKETGIMLENIVCTWIMSKLIYNDPKFKVSNGLSACLNRELGIKPLDKELQTSFKLGIENSKAQLKYLMLDIINLPALKEILDSKIHQAQQHIILQKELDLLPVLCKAEVKGIYLNIAKCKENIEEWHREIKPLELKLYKHYVKAGVNMKSPAKSDHKKYSSGLRKLHTNLSLEELWNKYEAPFPTIDDKDKKGNDIEKVSFGKLALADWRINYIGQHQELHDFIADLLLWRKYAKLISTYGEKLIQLVDEHGFIHPSFNQLGTNTGRISSNNPNAQNIPANDKVRGMFETREGHVFYIVDHDGQEVVIAASYSKEPVLMKALLEGLDHHTFLALETYKIIFGKSVTVEKGNHEPFEIDGYTYTPNQLRNEHKGALFATFYGGGARRIADIFSLFLSRHCKGREERVAQAISRTLKNNLPVLNEWLLKQKQLYEKDGYILSSKLGRRIKFFENAHGEPMNAPIQGTGAEAIKIAMINMYRFFKKMEKKYGIKDIGWVSLNIHDEIVAEIKEEYAEELKPQLDELMRKALTVLIDPPLEGKATGKLTKKWKK